MLSEEDRGPSWLRDYNVTDFGQIETDIQAMEKFAAGLAANVDDNYAPHLSPVSTAMTTRLPAPAPEFLELQSFLTIHHQAADASHQNVYNYANGTKGFADAATDVSKKYEGSDAFSHATVTDVDKALDNVGVPKDQTNPGGPASTGAQTPTEGDV